MQVEDGLPAAGADVHDHAVVGEARAARGLGDELEHPLRLLRRKLGDVAEGIDVALGEDQQVGVRLRVDVADRDEAFAARDVVAFANEPAEEAVVAQAARIPSSVTAAPRTRTSSPTGASTSHGE